MPTTTTTSPKGQEPSVSKALIRRSSSAVALAKLNDISSDLKRSSDWAGGIAAGGANSGGTGMTTGSSGTQIKALLEHAKDIVVQLRSVMEGGNDIGIVHLVEWKETIGDLHDSAGQAPTYESLITKLNTAFRYQAGVNQMTAKLQSVNYLVNLSNFSKTHQLTRAVAEGRTQVLELQRTVCSLEDNVDFLTVEADVQRQTAGRLKNALDDTRRLLEGAVAEYRGELGRQKEMLRKQTTVIGHLYKSRFNQDFILDATIFLFCLWAANTSLVTLPLQSAVNVLLQQLRFWFPTARNFDLGRSSNLLSNLRQQQIWSQKAAKLALVLIFVRRLRKSAANYGIHNRVGATYPYISSLFAIVYGGVAKRIPGLPSPDPTLDAP
ncbi:hypothetical protein HKX48_007701 [Thoreauomyces humboldtii]|nr:hypothetical protein HKX48_007701 [Thoreauomyces humboldtii]